MGSPSSSDVRIVRSRCGGLVGLAACVAACVVASAAGATSVPGWVKPTTERTAKRWFGSTPVRLDAIDLGNRVAIVATFSDVVRCRPCGSPDSRGVRGRIFRFSFDRTTRSPWSATALSIRRCASRSACYAGAPHITLSDGSDWKAVIGDVYADGRLDQAWSCALLRATVSHLPSDLDHSRIIETLDEAAAAACRAALGALARGDSPKTVVALLGTPDRRPGCWLYFWPPTRGSALIGARICFDDGRVSLIQRSVHG